MRSLLDIARNPHTHRPKFVFRTHLSQSKYQLEAPRAAKCATSRGAYKGPIEDVIAVDFRDTTRSFNRQTPKDLSS